MYSLDNKMEKYFWASSEWTPEINCNWINESCVYSTNLLIYLFRLLDLVNRRNVVFSNIQFYVLDEADRMLDMGFGPDINKCMIHPTMPTKENRNTLMFSATFPEDVRTNARKYLREVRLGHSFTSQ